MRKFWSIILVGLLVTGCKKEHDSECFDGTIQWTGDPAADGLGWTLVVNPESPKYYVLKNLPQAYQEDNLEVNACIYKTGERVNCLCQNPMEEYAVASIRRRQAPNP